VKYRDVRLNGAAGNFNGVHPNEGSEDSWVKFK
jgi:hypothetical protein